MSGNCSGREISLPYFHMTAGESKTLTIPVHNPEVAYTDIAEVSARIAISDYVVQSSCPAIIKDCTVTENNGLMILEATFDPEDTLNLYGKYVYEAFITTQDNEVRIMKGLLFIYYNHAPYIALSTLCPY